MTTDRPSQYLFAPELFGRLRWFVRLRWVAAFGLAAASVTGPLIGIPDVWPALLIVALFVGCCNVGFTMHLGNRSKRKQPYERLRACAVRQIVTDLAALTVTAHFTGGLQSPMLLFFAFHMAIGTIVLPTRVMYILAACTSGIMFVLYVLENSGVLLFHPLDPGRGICGTACHFNMAAFVFALIGVVALTDSVTSRFKERNIRLWETTEELKRRTAELQHTLEQVEIVEERKSHYMRISAHQLRSPLATVRTSLQVLTEGYVDPGSVRGKKLIDGAMERVDDLLAEVNDLLDLARIREGRDRAPWSKDVNINQLLADLLDTLSPQAVAREIRLVPDFNGVAVLDRGVAPDLVFAFENLIENAIKYSHDGGEVGIRLRIDGEKVRVEIEDRGIGIPEDFLDEILGEFIRAPNAKRHAPQGTGLGLAIAREAIEHHGGQLKLTNREDGGAVAIVTLPLHHGPATGLDM